MTVVVGAERGPILTASDPLRGHRHDQRVVADVLSMDDEVLGTLDGATGGSLSESIHTEIRATGSLSVVDPARFDWHRIRVGLRYEFRDEAGALHEHPLGVFLPTTAATRHSDTGATAEVDLYDKLTLLAQDQVSSTWSVDKGTTVVAAVSEVLASVGETRVQAPDDEGGALTSSTVWEPGTPKLRIVNDILGAGNFFAAWVDGNGVWRLDPYIEPTRRGVAWDHVAGRNAIFLAEFEHESDGWAVPNEVVVVGKPERDGDEELPAPHATAWNQDPDDPFSIPSRGRAITHTEQDQDVTSLDVLGQIAARRLLELSSVTESYKIQHAWVPADLNSAHRLRVPSAGIDALTVLQAREWSWDSDGVPGLVSATLRGVKQ